MSPRPFDNPNAGTVGGGGATQQTQGQPYADGDTHSPWNWPMPPDHRVVYGRDSMSSTPERTLSTSSTIIDNVVPCVYGSRKVVGMCGAREVGARYVKMGFVFAYGEQDSISNVKVNGEAIADCQTAGWLTYTTPHPGDGSTGISSILNTITNWSSSDTTLWQSLCHIAIQFDWYQAEMPSSITVTAELGGMLIDTTWRADGGSSSLASTNPVEIAYHILTSSSIWRGVDTTRIHDASWEDVAAWCEEDPGDATARWSYNGIIQWRDPDAATEEVLNHCFAAPYADLDGKIRLWAEMPPPAITGDWSCAGTTVTEDATSGSATTELAVGEMVYVGSSRRTVSSITDDDTFVIDSSATETSVKVRPISGVEIKKYNWMGSLEGTEANKNSTPDKCVVRWTDPDEWGGRETESEYGTPDADHYKRIETTYSGCTNNSMATRLGSHKLKVMWEQPYYWSGVADGTAADLEPGDVFLISDDVLTSTPVRLLPPKAILSNGGYQLAMREFDIGTYTNVTASPSTGAPAGGGWTTGVPDAPTAATQYFGYGGDWANDNIFPGDPDDLTGGATWFHSGDMAHSYSSTYDATSLYNDGSDTYTRVMIGWYEDGTDWDANYGHSRVLLTALVKFNANSDDNATWYLGYGTGADFENITPVWQQEIDPPANGEWIRVWGIFPIASGLGASYHMFGVMQEYEGTPPTSDQESIYIKRLMMIPWELDPQFSLYERWEWTEHASAASSVSTYQVYVDTPSGQTIVVHEVPQGTDEYEFPVVYSGLNPGGYINVRTGYYDYDMRAHGINGTNADFPSPTQTVEIRPWSGTLGAQSDVNTSARASGFGLSWDGTEYDHVPLARAYGTGGLTAWDDLRVSATSAKPGQTNPPGFEQIKTNGSGSTGVFTYVFDEASEEELFFTAQLPHRYKPGTDIKAHVHWAPTATTIVDRGVTWGLEYTWANIDAVLGNTTLIEATDTDTYSSADEHRVLALGTITGTGKAESSMLVCRIYRAATDSADNYPNDAALLEIDFHYQVEKFGTEDEYPS